MIKEKLETLDELVKKRKGYKYLRKDRTSPYQNYKYIFRKGKIFKTNDLDTNIKNECGPGWNLATLRWILKDNSNLLNNIIVEFSIPEEAKIIVPENSDGKFRTDIIKYKKIYQPYDLFPFLKDIQQKLKKYKIVNPINATKIPDKKIITKIWDSVRASVRASVWASVRASVWDSVGASVWDSVGASVRASVWASVRASVRASVGDSVWDSVGASVRASVGDSVWDSVWDQSLIAGYKALVDFLNLDYHHPSFDLIDLGIIIVKLNNKLNVYGKNGKFLGDIVL